MRCVVLALVAALAAVVVLPAQAITPLIAPTGQAAGDIFGVSVSLAGDVNGDGFPDLIVGAPYYREGGVGGRAYVFHGGPAADAVADLVLSGVVTGEGFGESVSSAGDINGDGFADLIVGAPYYREGGAFPIYGRAYVFHGGTAADAVADLVLTFPAHGQFGESVSSAGDMNGDGFDDLIVGAPHTSGGGRAHVYHGGPGADAVADLVLIGDPGAFGESVSSAGDMNGDGFADLIVGAPAYGPGGTWNGRAYVYHGGPGADAVADLVLTGTAGAALGWRVSSAGDVNGDGFVDLIVGAPGQFEGAGNAYVYHGGPGADAVADLVLTGASSDDFGGEVSSAGDVNGDGFADLIVAAGLDDTGGMDAGRVYVYHGGPEADAMADIVLTGEAAGDKFGASVSSAGDVNGDGFGDLIVGAFANDAGGIDAGRAYVYTIGPGFPTPSSGFPVVLPAGVISPPGICELDGDPESEIVFGDAAGYVRAYNHDGMPVPGWPRNIGTIPPPSPVAVADIGGSYSAEVVCGNTKGFVHGFSHDGTPLPGWPVELGTGANTYCSIGEILPGTGSQVVALSGGMVFVLEFDGTIAHGFPVSIGGAVRAGAAIGDVDGDGDKEIVTLNLSGGLSVVRGDGSVQASRLLPGESFYSAPTLGDLDLDGDLEIAAPTSSGDVYVFQHDGTSYPGSWPFTDPTLSPISSVAIANIRGTTRRELIFGVQDAGKPKVHALYDDGTELGNYPRPTGAGWYLFGDPIVDIIDNGSSDVLIGSRDRNGYAWTNFGVDGLGWPVSLPGPCDVSPATGDINQDGIIDVVFATAETPSLVMFSLSADLDRRPSRRAWWWPMSGYNPERQGCQSCEPGTVTGVPQLGSDPKGLEFRPPLPNPTHGSTTLSFVLDADAHVELAIVDLAGRAVRHLVRGDLESGPHRLTWDGRTDEGPLAPTGIYFAALSANDVKVSRRIVLIR